MYIGTYELNGDTLCVISHNIDEVISEIKFIKDAHYEAECNCTINNVRIFEAEEVTSEFLDEN